MKQPLTDSQWQEIARRAGWSGYGIALDYLKELARDWSWVEYENGLWSHETDTVLDEPITLDAVMAYEDHGATRVTAT